MNQQQEQVHETLDDMLVRHRLEAKALTAQVMALKKTVSKGASDKKKKKEVMDQIAQMEAELSKRHDEERARKEAEETGEAKATSESDDPLSTEADSKAEPTEAEAVVQEADGQIQELDAQVQKLGLGDAKATTEPSQAPSGPKKNRQKLRKEKKAAAMNEMRKQAELEASQVVNMREVEDSAIGALLKPMNLRIKEIIPDGHCLYNAIAHQLNLSQSDEDMTYKDVRGIAASYMRTNIDDFLPFLTSDSGDMMSPDEYESYCSSVERTAAWGGQLEIRAISSSLRREIDVVQMGSPVIKIGEEYRDSSPLKISYHRHSYGLGEHYNSLVAL
ncbi:uncharacterized protein BJ171DRAFT_524371 [Polychytrium aggregatum]|uniref:uncharacterized protein n=1 Tax=Polychytrium aggregatum TaxID=110093 RepID=UPI0022FE81AE|nr:uncharacterized protein BJ171DRAFT_524371 [Polychytrium aggregatum]KAI9193736.1 hypothetical protein BJ171DRAFT_524371 [Polychytrium aggregatum]